jgi:hypothetical protein
MDSNHRYLAKPVIGPRLREGPRLSTCIFNVGRSASDHQFVGDAAYIHLEIKAQHRRAREMPGQTARDSSAADELVGQERMDVEDRLDLRRGHRVPVILVNRTSAAPSAFPEAVVAGNGGNQVTPDRRRRGP